MNTNSCEPAEIFLSPSISEGFGSPILDAMPCDTPVITGNCTAMPEVAGNAAMLVDPFDYHSIAEAIVFIQGDQELRQSLIQQGKERVGHFFWKRTAEQLLTMYRTFDVDHKPAYTPV